MTDQYASNLRSTACRLLAILFELAPPASAIIGDNGLKEVQKGGLVECFIWMDLNRSRCQVSLSLVYETLGIGRDGVVDEDVEMILCSEQGTDIAIQRKIGLLCALDGLDHIGVGGMHKITHLAANILLYYDAEGNLHPSFKTLEQGAATTVWASVAPELAEIGGLYLADCQQAIPYDPDISKLTGYMPYALDPEHAGQIWTIAEELVKL